MTLIAAFHVDPTAQGKDQIARACSSYRAENDYVRLIDILFQSASLHEQDPRCVVLTDAATDFAALEGRAEIVRFPVDRDRVMYSRLLAQIDFLERSAGNQDTALVDSDMIVNAPFHRLFAEDFDVGLTYRQNEEMPINGGVIFVKGGRAAAAAEFLRQVCDVYAGKYFDKANWWGDQWALIDVVGRERFNQRTADVVFAAGAKIRLLPCERYNYSPDNQGRAIARPLTDKVILHFKGERKRLMPLYWDTHLAPRRPLDLQARWRAYRIRRQLRKAA